MKNADYKNPFYLEALAWCFLIALILLPIFYYNQLPEQIPSHFNAKGEVDDYKSKGFVWVLPIIGIAIFALLHFLSKDKNLKINGPTSNSPEELDYQRLVGRKLLNALKIILPASFLYINYKTILIGLGKANGLGPYFLYIFLITIFGVIGYHILQMYNYEVVQK